MKKKPMSIHAQCAKEIRKELKQHFPGIKLSVRSESFSMGDAVNVKWTDGPTDKAVNDIIGRYQYGHFDGMIDMYEDSNMRDDIPQVKFVQTERNMSDKTRDRIIKKHNDKFCEEAQIKDLNAWNVAYDCQNSSLIYRKFVDLDLIEVSSK